MASAAAKGSAAEFQLYIADGGQVDQLVRLNEFRAAHPGVEITKEDGYWQTRWTSPSGRAKAACSVELEWLLDMLDEHFPEAVA